MEQTEYESFLDKYRKEGVLILHGGSDIHPSLYNMPIFKSFCGQTPSESDLRQVEEIQNAVKKGQRIIANCRTHQMIAAMNGLKLIQDMYHPSPHKIIAKNLETNESDRPLYVNQAHHQCVWTENQLEHEDWEVYGYCKLSPYHHYHKDIKLDVQIEPEIMYFKKFRAFTVQFHLDWMTRNSHQFQETMDYCDKLIEKLLFNED